MKKISLLVSTVDLNFKQNTKFAEHIDFSICEVIVIQQLIGSQEKLSLDFDATVVSIKEKGLAKSRNRAIAHSNCPIALICDDDISFVKGFEQDILKAYSLYPDAALISFKIEDKQGNPYKNYLSTSMPHTFRSILRVNSIETSIQLSKFASNQHYDERFGLGASCPTGEDTIFAVDTFRAGLPCYFVDKTIVIHPLESSGKTFHANYSFHRGQVYRRAFGLLGLPFGMLFAFKKYHLYKKELGLLAFILRFWKGYFSEPS